MPYFYLYDSYLQDKKFSNQLIRLETTLADLGIQGKIGRLTLLKSMRDLIEGGLRDNTDTVVVVGNDTTFSQAAEVIAKKTKTTMGFIPLGEKNQTLADLFGIPIGLLACHTLSSRIIAQIDLGKINNQFFIRSVAGEGLASIDCDGQYQINLDSPHFIKICNLDSWPDQTQFVSDPQNNLLEVILAPKQMGSWWGSKKNKPSASLLPLKTFKISSLEKDELTLIVDGHKIVKTPVVLNVAVEKLRIIVGRNRLF